MITRTIIFNWKMRLGAKATSALWNTLSKERIPSGVDLVVCPSAPMLSALTSSKRRARIALGAQDIFWEMEGEYTGGVSPAMLREIGVRYVIVGHSETRKYLGETDDMVQRKVRAALQAKLTPILCIGETWDERAQGKREVVLLRELTKALQGTQLIGTQSILIAYEPRWAIGRGQAVSSEEIVNVFIFLKRALLDILTAQSAVKRVKLLYGGSVQPNNIADILAIEHIDGVLVGSASVSLKSIRGLFTAIV